MFTLQSRECLYREIKCFQYDTLRFQLSKCSKHSSLWFSTSRETFGGLVCVCGCVCVCVCVRARPCAHTQSGWGGWEGSKGYGGLSNCFLIRLYYFLTSLIFLLLEVLNVSNF